MSKVPEIASINNVAIGDRVTSCYGKCQKWSTWVCTVTQIISIPQKMSWIYWLFSYWLMGSWWRHGMVPELKRRHYHEYPGFLHIWSSVLLCPQWLGMKCSRWSGIWWCLKGGFCNPPWDILSGWCWICIMWFTSSSLLWGSISFEGMGLSSTEVCIYFFCHFQATDFWVMIDPKIKRSYPTFDMHKPIMQLSIYLEL